MPEDAVAFDVGETTFQREVIERSHDVPVVVDFWAAWCGPCRVLGPVLEEAVAARSGNVLLAKLDVDRDQRLAATYRVQGIPAVKAFRDGQVVAEFVGAQPRQAVDAFLDRVVPSEADRLVRQARAEEGPSAEATLRRALELQPDHRQAAVELARRLVGRDPDAALRLVAPHRPDEDAEEVAARAELARASEVDLDALRARVAAEPDDDGARLALGRALAASGAYEEAVDQLLAAVRAGGDGRDEARAQLVALFRVIGESPLVADARKRLTTTLF
ncbi:MAG TPA: tetratricopeptide repeat protein [Nitriliruptorales bacterium]|nr:tetratricopeptide repeat protein [Nitriliruptorales bacterium]